MMWLHKARMRWFSLDVKPLEMEIYIFESGRAKWRVKHDGKTLKEGKADCFMTASEVLPGIAEGIVANFKSYIAEKHAMENNIPVEKIELPTIDPEDLKGTVSFENDKSSITL